MFIIYINDLPLRINSVSKPVLFADGTPVIISSRNFKDLCSLSNLFLSCMIKWFAANYVLNLNKTNIMKFGTNSSRSTVHIGYEVKYIEGRVNIKFLCLQIYNQINWKNHTKQTIPKVSGTCYAIRLMVHISNISALKSVYYAYFHSIIKYEIIFWDNFQQLEDFHFTKENHKNYGWCSTQNLRQKYI